MLEFKYPGSWQNTYQGTYYLLTHPNTKNPRQLNQQVVVHTCREFFIKSLREKILKGDGFIHSARKAYALVTNGPSKAKDRNASMLSAAEKSLYIINSFEKEHKWPKTKVYPVNCINHDLPMVFWQGPRKWTTSPYLFSMWTLAIRLGKNTWLPSGLLKLSHEDLVRQLAITSKTKYSNTDANQLCKTIREWDNIMFLYKDLFGDNTRKYHWDLNHLYGHDSRPEGILKLITGSTYYKELYNKFLKLKKENKLQ
ncbi:MAG TPA: hypothetical protein VMV58_04485 [Desulfosporosinus sp.]|nr:hypothetical protein [Desulfosporosinus sp.]